jgi:hypothetical protein
MWKTEDSEFGSGNAECGMEKIEDEGKKGKKTIFNY